MKKLLPLIFLLFLIPAPAQASSHDIYLTSAPNRNYEGVLINKDFENSLAPEGELGKLIFKPIDRPRNWIADAALFEDIQFLAGKNSTLATNWLNRFKKVVGSDPIYATAYGNPDVIYLRSLAPAELNFYYEVGQQHLEAILNKNVRSEKGSGFAYQRASISSDIRDFFNTSREEFIYLSTVVNAKEVESDRARIGQLFNTKIKEADRDAVLKDFTNGQSAVMAKLRIVSGRYRLTTANEKVPITLVNDFESPVKVDLIFTPMNSRVVFPEYRQITLNAKSKTQVSVPIKTIAAGDTTVIASFQNGKGKVIGANGMLDISSTIISPAVTKFTTGAGILLILAAVAQSVRRVRKGRKSEK